jgi:hypothetical protein
MNTFLAFRGKVQEEELDSCRAAGERRPGSSGMWVQGETKAGSPCAILAQQKAGAAKCRPLCVSLLGHFLSGLGRRLRGLLGLLFSGKLLLYLEGDGIGVHLVRAGSITEDCGRIRPRGHQQDTCLHQQA